MTLDDFLSALENLIEDQESSDDDDPGEGNFGCEDCRACNQCRFCIGCDSCEDCTYCDECIDCTSGTQSKRCVSCEKFSYCEDCRDCKGSRYLTLCVDCTDCVHCLACVGISGGEFYVLNEKRTRKEYFSLLRQVQELMQDRMHAGWRPPGIGLASEIIDAVTANRDRDLSAAPWLDDLGLDSSRPVDFESEETYERTRNYASEEAPAPRRSEHAERERPGSSRDRDRDLRDRDRYPQDREPQDERTVPRRRDAERGRPEARRAEDPGYDRQPERDDNEWMRSPPEFGSSYREPVVEERPRPTNYERSESSWAKTRQDYGRDLGRDLSQDESANWGQPERGRGHDYDRGERRDPPRRESDRGREDSYARGSDFDDRESERERFDDYGDNSDVPRARDQQSTKPFDRRAAPNERPDEPAPRAHAWDDSRERTAARGQQGPDPRAPEDPRAPAESRGREPSSPWLEDDNPTRPARAVKPNSLRRAGRPKRPAQKDSNPTRDRTGTGSYRTGSVPDRSSSRRGRSDYDYVDSEGTNTGGTGLRLGRKPKRR